MTKSIITADHSAIWQLADEYMSHLQERVNAREISVATLQTYRTALNRFLEWAETQPVGDTAIGLHWKASIAHNTPNTVGVWLSAVRSFYKWAIVNGYANHNPFEGLRGSRRGGTNRKHLRDPLTDSEVRRLLEGVSQSTAEGIRDYAILTLMLYCGLRTIEIHRANLDHLRTQQQKVLLYVIGKGRIEADEFVVVPEKPAVALYAWLSKRPSVDPEAMFVSLSNRSYGQRLSDSAIRHQVKAHLKDVGIINRRKSTHSLRHTAITKAVQKGVQVQRVQSMARHASINTTMIYYHESDRIEDAAEEHIDYD